MVKRNACSPLMVVAAALGFHSLARAQFVQLVTDFEGTFSQPLNLAEVVFRDPSFSGTTVGLDPEVLDDTFLSNTATFPGIVIPHSGTQALLSAFAWEDPAAHASWVRLATTETADIPNPALHLGGRVRIWLAATAYTDDTLVTPVTSGNLFVGLGVRETGQGIPQGQDGGITGLVEWVGLSDKLVEILAGSNGLCDTAADPDTDDVQVNPPSSSVGPDGVCVDAGTNGILNTTAAGDDTVASTPVGLFNLPSDGVVREYVFHLPSLEASDNVFGLTGDGVLEATPNNRGTLEHLSLTNDPDNGAVNAKFWVLSIDDITFDSPVLDPPVIQTLPDPPQPLDDQVTLTGVHPDADLVEVFKIDPGRVDTILGSVDPAGETTVTVDTSLLPPTTIYARQTVGPNASDNSRGVVVSTPGNAPLRMAMAIRETDAHDAGLTCGDDGTGFDPDAPSTLEFIGAESTSSFGVPDGRRFVPQQGWREITFDPCVDGVTLFSGDGVIDVNSTGPTVGVWEGLYFRIDEIAPTTGPYTVYLDDLVVKNAGGAGQDCLLDDFDSYTPGDFIVGDFDGDGVANTTAAVTDVQVVPVDAPIFPGQIIVAPGGDGTLETEPEGDDGESPLHARFNFPGAAGTSVGLADEPDRTAVTDERSFSGPNSLKIEWAFVDATNHESLLRLTSNGSTATDPPETFVNPDPVVELTHAGCEDGIDLVFSVMVLFEPTPVPGDCDLDGDIDLRDYGCLQGCFGGSPVGAECAPFDIHPIDAPDDDVDIDDYQLFNILFIGPR